MEGTACSKGTWCGTEDAEGVSFEECKKRAENVEAYAFAYRGTSARNCRMCERTDFDTISSLNDWGIYKKEGKNTPLFSISMAETISNTHNLIKTCFCLSFCVRFSWVG